MSFFPKIERHFIVKKTKIEAERKIILKKHDQFQKLLLVCNQYDDKLVNKAKECFIHAEINSLYLRKQKKDTSGHFNFTVHSSDFNLTGKIKNDKLNKLTQTGFDMIVDLSENSDYLKYLISQTKNTLLIGKMDSSEKPFHDLLLSPENEKSDFIQTIIKQLNNLTANDK